MIRDVSQLEYSQFDVLVIGGGIYGAWTAYDASLRGVSVALVEKNDWASGTSSASTKLIHGGLRYLEQNRLGLVRRSLHERKRLSVLAPHRVMPLRFVVPVYRGGRLGTFRLRLGLSLYDWLGGPHQPVTGHSFIGRNDLLAAYPLLRREDLLGGFTYGDCLIDDARFTLEIVSGAIEAGAVAVNYAEVVELVHNGDRVSGAVVRDCVTGRSIDVKAHIVINTAGAWAPGLNGRFQKPVPIRLTKGVHLVLPPLGIDDGVMLTTQRDGRVFFMIPWYGKTLVGTTDTDFKGDPDHATVDPEDVDYLLSESNNFLQGTPWDESHVCGSFAGIRVLQNRDKKREPSFVTREWLLEETYERFLVSVGGKFTTARAEAAQIVDRVLKILNRPANGKSPTETKMFPWSPEEDFGSWQRQAICDGKKLGFDEENAKWLTLRYGTRVENVNALARSDPFLSQRVVPDLPFSFAEIVYGAEKEMVVSLEDLVRRRVPLLILHRLPRDTIEDVAARVAPRLGWSAEKRNEQVRATAGRWIR